MKHFIKNYKSEIALGICALTAGALSFFITLNLASNLNDSAETHDVLKNENIVAKNIENKISGENKILNNENLKIKNEFEVIDEEKGAKEVVLFDKKMEDENKKKDEKTLTNDNYGISENTPYKEVNEVFDANVTIETTSQNIKQEEKKVFEFILPISGDIILDFAQDKLVYSETLEEWIVHEGVDIRNEIGTPIKASEDGVIESVKMDPRYGNTIIIKHDDMYKTIYSNLSTLDKVYVGMGVKKGDIISSVGEGFGFECKEGPHVHFEIIENEINRNPNIKR